MTSSDYPFRILLAGILVTGIGLYQLPTIWTFKSSLVPLYGTVRSADIYIRNVTDRKGHSSHLSELIFYLHQHNKKFYLVENIGSAYRNEEYLHILRGIRKADSVTIWIKESDIAEYQPKVFQIDQDKKITLLNFDKVRTDRSLFAAFLLVLGIGSIGFYFWTKYPDKFKRFFN